MSKKPKYLVIKDAVIRYLDARAANNWGDPVNRDCFYGFVKYMEGREDVDFDFILRKWFLIQFLDIFYNRTGYTDTDAWKTKDMYGDPLIGMTFGDIQYRIVFEERDISQMITYLRETYATFYTPDRKGPCYIDYHSLAKQRHEAAKRHNDILLMGVPFRCLTETQRLQKENRELKEEVSILRDLVNKIHEETEF